MPYASVLKGPTLALAALAFGAAACGSNDNVFVPPPPAVVVGLTGTLILDWTINGTKDPAACTQLGVNALQVSIVSRDTGLNAGTFAQACTAFATSIPLPSGNYSANALLVDSTGVARTTIVPIDFTLFGNDQLIVPIDFPFNSFFSAPADAGAPNDASANGS